MKVPRWNNVASPRSGSSLAGAPSPVRRTLAAALAFGTTFGAGAAAGRGKQQASASARERKPES